MAATLIILGLKVSDGSELGSIGADVILYRLNRYLVFYSLLGLTTTALVYGLYTNWGIMKHRWIIIKWFLLFSIVGIYIVSFSPSVNGLVSLSSGGLNSGNTGKMYDALIQKSLAGNIILLSFLLIIFFLSTIKPFGRRKSDFLAENKFARISIITFVFFSVGFGLMGWINLNRLRSMEINSPDLSNIDDGIYKGEFSDGGGVYVVVIEIKNHRMSQIDFTTDRNSIYVDYARPIADRIIAKQSLLVDEITGATTTSKCIIKAAENALKETNTTDEVAH